jgi:preprotein translocase subunit SecF
MWNVTPTWLLAVSLVAAATPAAAYIGPGAGAGTIAVVLGVLASIVMAFIALLWYPMKRLLKSKKQSPKLGSEAPGLGRADGPPNRS